jgi:hypothetical protein
MAQGVYYSTHEATLFIGGFWVDDAQAIQWQVADPKEPLYGFRDVFFRDLARGQTIVHGALDINFRFRGYLSNLIEQFSTLRSAGIDPNKSITDAEFAEIQHAMTAGNDFLNQDLDPRGISASDMLDLLQKPFRKHEMAKFRKLAKAAKETFHGEIDPTLGIEASSQDLPRPGLYDKGIDIHVIYEDPEESNAQAEIDPARTRVIQDVHFVAESQVLMNAVPGGGEPVVERYQFIAKNVI